MRVNNKTESDNRIVEIFRGSVECKISPFLCPEFSMLILDFAKSSKGIKCRKFPRLKIIGQRRSEKMEEQGQPEDDEDEDDEDIKNVRDERRRL